MATEFDDRTESYRIIYGRQSIRKLANELKTARVQFGTTQQFVKAGQIRDARQKNGTNWRPGRPLIFSRLEVKNRDCPGKSGTDGHFSLRSNISYCLNRFATILVDNSTPAWFRAKLCTSKQLQHSTMSALLQCAMRMFCGPR